MDVKRAIEDATRLVEWCKLNGQLDKPITFPAQLRKKIELDADGKWHGHPVAFKDSVVNRGVAK